MTGVRTEERMTMSVGDLARMLATPRGDVILGECYSEEIIYVKDEIEEYVRCRTKMVQKIKMCNGIVSSETRVDEMSMWSSEH